MNAYLNQYKNNQINTASPEKILVMLYDGAIRFTRQAIQAMESKDKRVQSEKIHRAMAIICAFADTLDHNIGGEIAEDLDALYHFMIRELTRANINNDRKALDTVEDLLTGLRETWVEAIDIKNREKQVQGVPRQSRIAASL